jgi:t-SNARE complex subunit (syntaxin)
MDMHGKKAIVVSGICLVVFLIILSIVISLRANY